MHLFIFSILRLSSFSSFSVFPFVSLYIVIFLFSLSPFPSHCPFQYYLSFSLFYPISTTVYLFFMFSSFTTLPFFCLCFPLSLYPPLPRLSLVFLNLILFLFFPHYSSPPKNYLHFPFLLILCFSLQFKGNESRDCLHTSILIGLPIHRDENFAHFCK